MVNLHIFHSISARELLAEADTPLEASGLGVYFHVYQDADRPFYIGISDDIAGRNRDHLENIRPGRWPPREYRLLPVTPVRRRYERCEG